MLMLYDYSMNNNTVILGYAIAAIEILFGIVGLITGWISQVEAITLIGIGASTFGIHHSNVATASAVRGI